MMVRVPDFDQLRKKVCKPCLCVTLILLLLEHKAFIVLLASGLTYGLFRLRRCSAPRAATGLIRPRGRTPLHRAAEECYWEVAQRLIDARADLKVRDKQGPGAWKRKRLVSAYLGSIQNRIQRYPKRAAMFLSDVDSVDTTFETESIQLKFRRLANFNILGEPTRIQGIMCRLYVTHSGHCSEARPHGTLPKRMAGRR